ncbi:hypothetical protein E1211_04385 [Micromonospora sp. 15K316]|uniref:hypothetical protein n=1 Tax=Micromonospora sp. 15K316 TaxID=2530376 RepID=UPI001046322A|nr:hypothetical protein [Micromonospora sp. 15K316]TDC39409.1 hypothetical protein E1211_04385 [Micromonospora sp. 15K316]
MDEPQGDGPDRLRSEVEQVQDPRWMSLSRQVRERIDENLRRGWVIQAAVLLRSHEGLDPRPGLHEAQDMLVERSARLRAEGLAEPEKPQVEVDHAAPEHRG